MKEIKAAEIGGNVFKLISKDWMLLTAGRIDDYNMMTANWGLMGEAWGSNVVEILVRHSCLTREYIDREGRFTMTFFPDEMYKALEVMGTRSGRDFDKKNYPGLQAEALPTGQVTFCGARLVVECEVVYHDPIDPAHFVSPDLAKEFYSEGDPHERYYARIMRVWTPD